MLANIRNTTLTLALLGSSLASGWATATEATAVTGSKILASCWDLTFAFNAYTIQETAQNYLVTVSGSDLAPDTGFNLKNGTDHVVVDQFFQEFMATAVFPKEACDWQPESQSIACETPAGSAQPVFVPRRVDDLGQPQAVISKFLTGRIQVTASPERLTLDKTDRSGIQQSLLIERGNTPLVCGNDYVRPAPQRLVDHL